MESNCLKTAQKNENTKDLFESDCQEKEDNSWSIDSALIIDSYANLQNKGNMMVVCRFRPLLQNELNREDSNTSVDFHPNKSYLIRRINKNFI